jgi:Flp pilus assembly protein TadG
MKHSFIGSGKMMRIFRTCRDFGREDSGAALVESAIILPLMITLSAGVYEFSNAIYTRLLLEAGVADGARYLARCIHLAGDEAACETAAENLAVTGSVTSGGTARVSGWTTTDVSISYTTFPITVDSSTGLQTYRSPSADVDVAQVSTDYSYAGTGLLSVLGFGPLTLSVAHQERVIGW